MRYISGGETGNVELPFFASSSSPFAQKNNRRSKSDVRVTSVILRKKYQVRCKWGEDSFSRRRKQFRVQQLQQRDK